MAEKGKSQFALVYWISDDKVGVMPTKACSGGF